VKAAIKGARAPRTAVLAGRQPVDVDDVSRTGCRLTGPEALGVGDIGMLTVTIDGEVHVDLFRVSRSDTLPGDARLYQVGVEFLPMPGGARSLHDLAAQLDDSHSM
jgi:hypothetical protein